MAQITESQSNTDKVKKKARDERKKTKQKKVNNMTVSEKNQLLQDIAEELGFQFKD